MTPDAHDAFVRAGFSRRDFLKTSGVLVVTFGAASVLPQCWRTRAVRHPAVPHRSAAARFVDCDWRRRQDHRVYRQVRSRSGNADGADAARRRGTVGAARALSRSCSATPTSVPIRERPLGASRRRPTSTIAISPRPRRPLAKRSRRWRRRGSVCRASSSTIDGGVISVKGNGSKRVTYGELVAGKIVQPRSSIRRRSGNRRASGRCSARRCRALDMAAMATGAFEFVHNVRVPGMLHGAVVRPPAPGAVADERRRELGRRVCRASSRSSTRKNFVGRGRREAMAGAPGRIEAEGGVEPRTRVCRRSATSTTTCASSRRATRSSSIRRTWTRGCRRRRRSSRRPTCIRIRCTARWARRARSPTCRATRRRSGRRHSRRIRRAAALRCCSDLPPDNVRVVFVRGAGCYGINGADTVSYDAALLSQAVGKPVRVQLSRQDEMAWENYGFPYVIDQRVGLDADGDDRRVGLRSVVRVDGRPAGHEHARQRHHRDARRIFAGAVRAAQPRPNLAGASTTAATPRRRMSSAASAATAAARASSPASAC